MAKPKPRSRKRKPAGDFVPPLVEVVEVIAKIEKRLSRLERPHRTIGFHTDCESAKEIPDPTDEDEEV